MNAAHVLAQARAAGLEVLIQNGRLASRGPATPELRAAIRAHKGELVALLSAVGVCGHCRRPVTEREVVDIGHDVLLHKACGRWVRPAAS